MALDKFAGEPTTQFNQVDVFTTHPRVVLRGDQPARNLVW